MNSGPITGTHGENPFTEVLGDEKEHRFERLLEIDEGDRIEEVGRAVCHDILYFCARVLATWPIPVPAWTI